jgi:hypothetical protein
MICGSLSVAQLRACRSIFKSTRQKWHVRAKLANILPPNWGYRQVLPIMLDTLRVRLHHKRQRVRAPHSPGPKIYVYIKEGVAFAYTCTLHAAAAVCYLICSRRRRNVVGHLRAGCWRLNHFYLWGPRFGWPAPPLSIILIIECDERLFRVSVNQFVFTRCTRRGKYIYRFWNIKSKIESLFMLPSVCLLGVNLANLLLIGFCVYSLHFQTRVFY